MFELGNDGPSLILVGVDGSETSLRAGAYAAGLARRQNSKLTCLYVHAPNSVGATLPSAIAANVENNVAVADEIRQMINTNTERLGLDASFVERHGNPYAELVALADELKADAVVVGASMRAGHRFIGSLAAHLVRDARWPVVVVP